MTILTSTWHAAVRSVAVALATTLLISCGQDSPQKLMASAKDYLAKGDRSAAVIQLKNLLSKTPDNGEARFLLGESLLETEDYVSAEKELARALELKQPHEKVLPAYVRSLLAQGKIQAVVAEVEKYKLFDPPAVAATQTSLGDAQMQLGNRTRAREAYAAAVAAVPGYPRARLGEAMLVALEGRIDEALKQIDEIAAAEPNLGEARAFRADILLAKGDRDGAKKALQEAIASNGRLLLPRLALISLLLDDRNLDAASTLLEETRRVAPRDLRVIYFDSMLAFRKGDTARARQQVQQVLKFLPDHLPSLVLAGAIELKLNQFTLAEEHLRRAVARAPGHRTAREMLVSAQLRMGQPARAKETLQPFLSRGVPSDPRLLLLAGETYLANGDVKQATAFYQAASAKGRESQGAAARTRLGELALATGKSEEGFKELEAASELDAGAYQADLALIAGHLRRNELDKAMVAVQALEKKQPKNPLTFQMYGLVHLAKRDVPAARRNFDRALELQPNYLPAAYNLAMLDMAEKRPEDARKRYEAMIAKDEKNDQLYVALADLLARTGAEAKLIGETLQRAVNANPQSAPARLVLINFYQRNKDIKAALTAAQNAMAAMPGDPRVLDAAGVAQEAAGEINQAIETYGKLASMQPQATQPLLRLSALYVRQGQTDKAVETLRRLQKIVPNQREVVPQLAEVYMAAGRYEDAFKEARDLQKREPKFSGGYSLEGDIYLAQRKFAEAERAYREALKLAPKSTPLALRLHGTLAAADKTAEADAWSKKWIAENPKDAVMRTYLGEREVVLKNLKVAAAHFQAAVVIDPNNVVALNSLAWIGGELGDPKALGHAERAVKLAPNDGAVLDTYGVLLVKKGDVANGLAYLERARLLTPGRNDIRLNYAKALIKANRKDDARKELQALSKITENFSGKDQVAGLLKGL